MKIDAVEARGRGAGKEEHSKRQADHAKSRQNSRAGSLLVSVLLLRPPPRTKTAVIRTVLQRKEDGKVSTQKALAVLSRLDSVAQTTPWRIAPSIWLSPSWSPLPRA